MIDWGFLGTLEGNRLTGYVPDATYSQSGVTVASGVDLGQMNAASIAGLPAELQERLRPYLGLHGMAAETRLQSTPLTITPDEAHLLDQLAEGNTLKSLVSHYNLLAPRHFDSLPDALQTVMASVTFQYGSPWDRCPNFWSACCAANVAQIVHELENFGDRYPSRRKLEAAYLQSHTQAAA